MSSPRQQEGNGRPRILSFSSNKSSGSGGKLDLTETTKEKRRITSKADPSMAMNEAQPAAIALEESNLENLRLMQHKDASGNVITDPDLSNPTRHRLERPLDTIRSFEAAIDGSYNRRFSYMRPESKGDVMGANFSRRNSYFGVYNNPPQNRGPPDGGFYYGNRSNGPRPDSFIDNYTSPNQHNQARGNRYSQQRVNSDPTLYGNHAPPQVYPSHGYQQSYDTVNSGGSGSNSRGTDPWGNSTDPSSENSSMDRLQPTVKPEERNVGEQYGFNGFGGVPQLDYSHEGYAQPQYGPSGSNDFANNRSQGPSIPPPSVPPKEIRPRVPIKLDGPAGAQLDRQKSRPEAGEKRKSWFKRRFSRD